MEGYFFGRKSYVSIAAPFTTQKRGMLHLRQPLFTGKQQAVSRAIRGTGRRPGPGRDAQSAHHPDSDIPQKKPKGKPVPEQREAPPQDGHAKRPLRWEGIPAG